MTVRRLKINYQLCLLQIRIPNLQQYKLLQLGPFGYFITVKSLIKLTVSTKEFWNSSCLATLLISYQLLRRMEIQHPHRNLTLVKKIGSKILVSGSNSITNLNWTPTFEYCVGLGLHLRTPKWHQVFNRDWTPRSKSVTYSRFHRQHKWGDLHNHSRRKTNFSL